jgi:glycosyltransferase involved in cell wall biosynthesis
MKISFCIPTYNRINSLKLAIKSILNNNFKDFEICISDNNSNDGTVEFLNQISSSLIRINYQSKNVGIDNNMLSVMKMAQGEYIFLLGDDDYLNKKSASELNLIINKNPTLVVFSKINKHHEILNDLERAYKLIWDKMSFGYVIFKKELIDTDFQIDFLETYHAYSGWILTGIQKVSKIKDVKIVLSPIEIVKTNPVKKTWSSNSFEVYFVGIPKFLNLIELDSHKEIYRNYISNSTKTYNLIRDKAVKNLKYDKKLYENLKKHYSILSIIKIKFLLSIPLHKLYKFIKKL